MNRDPLGLVFVAFTVFAVALALAMVGALMLLNHDAHTLPCALGVTALLVLAGWVARAGGREIAGWWRCV